jgi:DNA replication and repair protein RecF
VPFLSVSFTNFRNIANDTIDLLSKEVYFIGENGQGKSNILESLYVSSYGVSFRCHTDAEMMKNDTKGYSIRALFRDQNCRTNSISVYFEEGKKRIEKNGKAVIDRKQLVDTIPCVLFSHEDLDFAIGSPERRRFFIDQSLSLYDPQYIDCLRKFKKVLKTRNALLRERNTGLLDTIDFQFAEAGLEVISRRSKTIASFNRVFARMYEEVTGIDNVTIDYSPSWKAETAESVVESLFERRSADLDFSNSMTGPHRDRIRFIRNGRAFVPSASTGQRRLLSLLLRSAQARFYTEITGRLPVLLMDDVLLELDPDKRQRFTSILPEYDQLFCTFLPGEPYERYKKTTTRIYEISSGVWNAK